MIFLIKSNNWKRGLLFTKRNHFKKIKTPFLKKSHFSTREREECLQQTISRRDIIDKVYNFGGE